MSGQSAAGRYQVPVDVHMVLLREGPTGQQVLLSRRAGEVYASGMWHLPSGHLDGPHEDVIDGGWRELLEETGIRTERADVRAGVTVHHRAPAGSARIGMFLVVGVWQGEPEITEPALCDGMDWFGWEALPKPMVAYCRAGLDAYRAGARLAVHFQQPGDSIAYDPAVDRLQLIPNALAPGDAALPEEAVRVFAEQAVGRIAQWTDSSWPREESQVWRATGGRGGGWYVKRHQDERFHGREVAALRHWVPALGARAPRLVAAESAHRTVVLTELAGRPLHGETLSAEVERDVHRQVGELTARYHQAAPASPARRPGRANCSATWTPPARCWPPVTRSWPSPSPRAATPWCPRHGCRPAATSSPATSSWHPPAMAACGPG